MSASGAADDAAVLALVRPELRAFSGYQSARSQALGGEIWLNANESPWANPADDAGQCRRYPQPQPDALCQRLAALYGVASAQVLVGRGSDEAIDLLVRATCRPGQDAVLVTPPVFGMYAVSAHLQGAPLREVPLHDDAQAGLVPDLARIAQVAREDNARVVFVCTPGNPGGSAVALADIAALARQLVGQAWVVVDEAYGEFSEVPSAATLLPAHPNLVVLRTLSKAHGLAGARIGVALGAPTLLAVLRRCQAPYPIAQPSAALALAGLSAPALATTRQRVAQVQAERARLAAGLAHAAGVRRVYPSQANFLLVRFDDADAAFAALLAAGVVVRDQRQAPGLGDALRITVGTPAQNDQVLAVLARLPQAGAAFRTT